MITEKDCVLLANFRFQQVDRHEFITYVMHQRASMNNLTISYRKKKKIDVTFSLVYPVIDYEFALNLSELSADDKIHDQ